MPSTKQQLESPDTVELGLSSPGFLQELTSDPQEAFEHFYHFAARVFRQRPPRVIVSLGPEDREDALHDLVYHCCRNDFRKLRSYTDRGRPFSCWLRSVAKRLCLDFVRKRPKDPLFNAEPDVAIPDGPVDAVAHHPEAATALDLTLRFMAELDKESKLLMIGSANGLRPRELARLLGWTAPNSNRRASDRCRYLRRRLKVRLAEVGVDLATVLPPKRRDAAKRGQRSPAA